MRGGRQRGACGTAHGKTLWTDIRTLTLILSEMGGHRVEGHDQRK